MDSGLLRMAIHVAAMRPDILILRDAPTPLHQYTPDPRSDDRLNPQDYLSMARQDLQGEDQRAWINALGNAKRAIDCQAERFALCLGLPPCDRGQVPDNVLHFMRHEPGKQKWEVAALLPLIAELDVAPRTVMEHYRSLRNQMEHDQAKVNRVTATGAVEWADLFLSAVDRAMRSFVGVIVIGDALIGWNDEGKPSFALRIRPEPKGDGKPLRFELTEYHEEEGQQSLVVTANQRGYLEIMNLMLAIDLGNSVPDALRRLVVSAGAEVALPAMEDMVVEVDWM